MAFVVGGIHRTGGYRWNDDQRVRCGCIEQYRLVSGILSRSRNGCGTFRLAEPDAQSAVSASLPSQAVAHAELSGQRALRVHLGCHSLGCRR